eukprot:CAMPEP_0185182078 /NCGR_PEP_ID=MMETSP1140-20130426/1117_1 /TAXON_ID=298111 /ORGANISM="Pavlova sp., Strain CCMP459" /LENGTH=45 /DNA_ID= /DNA_START= /DNA_END= /DNA_ORIENTATION=
MAQAHVPILAARARLWSTFTSVSALPRRSSAASLIGHRGTWILSV